MSQFFPPVCVVGIVHFMVVIELQVKHWSHVAWEILSYHTSLTIFYFYWKVWTQKAAAVDVQTHAVKPSYSNAKLSWFWASRIRKSTCSCTREHLLESGSLPSSLLLILRHTDTAYTFLRCSFWLDPLLLVIVVDVAVVRN